MSIRSLAALMLIAGIFCGGTLEARTVYLVRCGQSFDKNFRDTRVKEFKLTDLGVEQSELMAKYLLEEEKFNGTVISSPIYYAIQTALPVVKALNTKMVLEPGFQSFAPRPKLNPRGMTLKEINARFPGAAEAGPNFKDGWRVRGENIAARRARVKKTFDEVLEKYSGNLLIVTHAAIVNDIVALLNRRCAKGVGRISGTAWNCCIFIFELNDKGRVTESEYVGTHMSDDKCTNNFRPPKIARPGDPRYLTMEQLLAEREKAKKQQQENK